MHVSRRKRDGEVFQHPPTPDNTPEVLPMTTVTHALYRIHPDASEELVSEHPTVTEGWGAGTSAVHADRDHAYALYRGRTRVAKFGEVSAWGRGRGQPRTAGDAG
jgi:hypothetical protein